MIDPQDDDRGLIVVDLVDHPIRPSSCGVKPGKFALQTSADAMGLSTKAPSMNSTIAAAVPSVSRPRCRCAGPVTRSS